MFAERNSRALSCLGSPDVGHLDIEVERLPCQRMIEIHDDGFVLDLVNAHGDGLTLRVLACHYAAPLYYAEVRLYYGELQLQ